jgi:hypothetical protein
MGTMITEVYDAFTSAQALADYQKDISELRSDMNLLKWMIGFNLAISLAVLWKLIA